MADRLHAGMDESPAYCYRSAMTKARRPHKIAGPLKFIIIAVVAMLLADHYIFGKRDEVEAPANKPQNQAEIVRAPEFILPPERVVPPDGHDYFEEIPVYEEEKSEADLNKPIPSPLPMPPTTPPARSEVARIAIVIDDIGMDIKRSEKAINLPAPITMAMLPYAPSVRKMAAKAKERGHTLIIHTPMEAMDGHVNIGPIGIREGMSAQDVTAAMDKMLGSFDGYEGINNHMGSRATTDQVLMDSVMKELDKRGLFFLDSKTSPKSVAEYAAASHGLKHASRDVFIDHVETLDFARSALKKTEHLALSRGYAIAIGHPKDFTLQALNEWIPTLEAKGIKLVSVKELLSTSKREKPVASVPEALPQEEKVILPPAMPAVAATPQQDTAPAQDVFFDDVNKVFAPSSAEPEIELHPLPPQ